MNVRKALCSFPVVFLISFGLGAAETPKLTPAIAKTEQPAAKPEELIPKLNDDDFEVRFSAYRKLEALGESARPALEKVAVSHDEIGDEARRLLDSLKHTSLDILAFDRDGKPAAGAEADMTLNDYSGRQPSPEQITIKEDGTSNIQAKTPGLYYGYFNWKKGFSLIDQSHYGWFRLKEGHMPYFFTLARCATIKTVVLDGDGKPLNGARLMLLQDNGYDLDLENLCNNDRCGGSNLTQTSGEDGKLTLENIPDGVYNVVLSHEKHESIVRKSLRIREGETLEFPLQWMIAQPKGKIEITVHRRDGTALQNAQVNVELKPVIFGPEYKDPKKHRYNPYYYNNWQRGLQQQTNEEGKITLENIKSGRYEVTATGWDPNVQQQYNPFGQQAPLDFQAQTIVVDPEKPLELSLTPATGGAIFGRIVNATGKGIRGAPVFAVPEEELANPDFTAFDESGHINYDVQPYKSEWTHGSGIFKFQRLNPGRYALIARTPSGDRAIAYGIDVARGKMNVIPDIVLPDAKEVMHLKNLAGRVVLPDGLPAGGTNIQIQMTMASQNCSTSWGRQTDGNGAFSFGDNAQYYDQWYTPTQLTIHKAGYKTVMIDLQKIENPQEPLLIKLEKRGVGKLCVTITDESGKPLRGVQVYAANRNQNYANYYYSRGDNHKTDRHGQVHFSGLADGERKIIAVLDGYFCEGEPVTKITADADNQFALTMKTGLKIKGLLNAPPGTPLSKAVVMLRCDEYYQFISQPVHEDGTFSFEGLAPGNYTISAKAPGMVTSRETKFVLKSDQKEPLPVSVSMLRASGVALSVPAEMTGGRVQMIKPDWAADFLEDCTINSQWPSVLIDANGRAEMWGVPAGDYKLQFTPRPDYGWNYYNNYSQNIDVHAIRILNGVRVPSLKSVSELASLKATEVRDTAKSGTAILKLDLKALEGVKNLFCYQVNFVAIGENGAATFSYSPRNGVKTDTHKTIVFGQPLVEAKVAEGNHYALHDLPPGNYKLYAKNYIFANRNKHEEKKAEVPAPLAEFTVKEGETIDLGSISVPAPPPEALIDPKDDPQNDYSADQQEFYSSFNP